MQFNMLVLAMVWFLPLTMVGQSSPPPSPSNNSRGDQQLSKSDQTFLKALIQEDTSEIQLGKMALEKSENPQVKQYAQSKILAADPEMRDGAEKIAREHGVEPPTNVGATKQKIQNELSTKSGRIFDNAYMNYEASAQSDDLKLVNAELDSTQDPEMKNYVTAQKTPVEQAAKSAVQVSEQISSSMTHYKQSASRTPDESKP